MRISPNDPVTNQDYINKMNYPDSSKSVNQTSPWPRNGSTYHPIKGNPENSSVGVKSPKLDN